MKGDFSRVTFDPLKGFSRLLMQQGRVQLDADWNEMVEIQLHLLRQLAVDLIGPHGGPAGAFKVEQELNDSNKLVGFTLAPGHYYVDGILVENPTGYSYKEQHADKEKDKLPDLPFLVYLDVWEEFLTSLDDDDIREVALNGADTAARTRVCWDVLLSPPSNWQQDGFDWQKHFESLRETYQKLGTLKAWTRKPGGADMDAPCILDSESGYRRADNRLYRVEIHDPSFKDGKLQTPSFKWSRDNGSVAFEWLDTRGDELVVSGVRDLERGSAAEQWVELLDAPRERRGQPGTLVRLKSVDGDCLTIDRNSAVGSLDPKDFTDHPRLRRWDHVALGPKEIASGKPAGAVLLEPDKPLELEAGIMIQFEKPTKDGPFYRSGDYWLIPARAATGDILWPQEKDSSGKSTAAARPPQGVAHAFAPLGAFFMDAGALKFENLRREIKLVVS